MIRFLGLNIPSILAKFLFLVISANIFTDANFSQFLAIQVLSGLFVTLGLSGRDVMIINGKKENAVSRLAEVAVEASVISLTLVLVSVWLAKVEQPLLLWIALVASELVIACLLVLSRSFQDNKFYIFIQTLRALLPLVFLILVVFVWPSYEGSHAAAIVVVANVVTVVVLGNRWVRKLTSVKRIKIFRRDATNRLILPSASSRVQSSLDVILVTSSSLVHASSSELFHFALAARLASNVLIIENLQRAFFQKKISNWIDDGSFINAAKVLKQVCFMNFVLLAVCVMCFVFFESSLNKYLFTRFEANAVFIVAFLAKTALLLSAASGLYLPKFGAEKFMLTLDCSGILCLVTAAVFVDDLQVFLLVALVLNLLIAGLRFGRLYQNVR